MPTGRIHPQLVAQAAATCAVLARGDAYSSEWALARRSKEPYSVTLAPDVGAPKMLEEAVEVHSHPLGRAAKPGYLSRQATTS